MLKIFLILVVCLLQAVNIFAQPETEVQSNKPEIGVAEFYVARDDGAGDAGEPTKIFAASDIPIHLVIRLASAAAVTVKINVAAVKISGLKFGTSVVAVSYRTDGTQTGVRFNVSPEKNWAAGDYRAEVLLDGKQFASQTFAVRDATSSKPKTKSSAPRRRLAASRKS